MLLHGLTIFLSAFLLFLAQPILAKLILPRFGGGVAVWATCLVFFQAALLLGYAYAHQLVRRDGITKLRYAHLVLLLASLALLPIIPAPHGPWPANGAPGVQILVLLIATIGLPFTLLATTSPLLQAWIASGPAGRNPYRLFAVSNLASLAALVLYPWLIEPWLRTATQAKVWSAGYAAYVALVCFASVARAPTKDSSVRHADEGIADPPPSRARSLAWIGLAALASYELVAITNHLTQNIPSIPMMWVLPLALYLLSFALCFDADRWYAPRPFFVATLLALLAMCWFLVDDRFVNDIGWQAGVFLAGLFLVCMYCHGELAASRPSPSRLTHFYLCVAAGGVLGGAAVALGAPALLPGYFEVEIGLVLLAAAVLWRSGNRHRLRAAAGVLVLLCTAATAVHRIEQSLGEVVAMNRNFYGVLRVREHGSIERTLMHGSIMHGEQYLSYERRREPTSYYTETSGVGRLLTALDDRRLEVGLVGLGAGTLAAYGKPGDAYHFYEIDPAVVDSARRHFTFLADSQASVDVQVGDGRLLLQAEPPQRFDVLVIDAFTGDSIPIHLLTREALVLYSERIKPQGVIALHISNRYLDLRPVIGRLAAEMGLQLAYVEERESDTDPDKASSNWILLARDRSILDLPDIKEAVVDLPMTTRRPLWTDDYSNILQVISF
ncbi:MAG TPA: fused MFS/spermidine synthase [Burkholderiaceae bacterium]|nr:fused MFS/spermidine synthase [Burkholderiaceae bacterium]